MLQIRRMPVGQIGTNCYLLEDLEAKTCAVIDPGDQADDIAREIDRDPKLLIAVQPTRGVDVGAIEMIHRELVKQRDLGKAILLVSLELDEVMDVPDRILVIYEGEIMGEFDPGNVTVEELGLYMTGSRRQEVKS